jgi:hypothetical protein
MRQTLRHLRLELPSEFTGEVSRSPSVKVFSGAFELGSSVMVCCSVRVDGSVAHRSFVGVVQFPTQIELPFAEVERIVGDA